MAGSKLVKNKGTQWDTIKIIHDLAFQFSKNPQLREMGLDIVRHNPNNRVEQLKEVFDLAFNGAYYYPDPTNKQTIRTPIRLLKDRYGNCVDYTLFIATMLIILKIPGALKMVKFAPNENYSHIYTVTQTTPEIILDPVIGQDQTGNEVLKGNKRQSFFNKEEPFYKCYIMPLNNENRNFTRNWV